MTRKRTRAEIAADKLRTGRPSMGADARVIPIVVKVSANELAVWKKKAAAAGIGLGAWLLQSRRNRPGD